MNFWITLNLINVAFNLVILGLDFSKLPAINMIAGLVAVLCLIMIIPKDDSY